MTKHIQKHSIVAIAIALSLMTFSCEEEPAVETIPVLGKRDYTWTVDTLAYPGSFQTLMRDIWASSPNDVYVVGHNDQGGHGAMYHYDGAKWTPVKLLVRDGGGVPNAPIGLSAVYGFASNDVWAVGEHIYQNPNPPPNFLDSSLIIHFDGRVWREVPIEKGRFLTGISGTSSKNIWISGWGLNSTLRYDGIAWNRQTIPVNIPKGGFFQTVSPAMVSPTELYMLANTNVNSQAKDIYYFLHYKDSIWTLLDTATMEYGRYEYKWGFANFWRSPWGKLYSAGIGAYVYENKVWKKILDSDVWLMTITGSAENNMFAVGQFGRIYHWNGVDWKTVTSFPPTAVALTTEWMFDTWTNGKEVFIIGQVQGQTTIILHGK